MKFRSLKSIKLKCLAMAAFAGLMAQPSSGATIVGLELSLLVDVSGSVSETEFNLQRDGYVAAFRSPAIHALITTLASQNSGGGLAVNYIEWDATPTQSVGWTHLFDAASSNAFADAIALTTFSVGSGTGLARALDFATPLFASNAFDGVRQVIDVSGDGANNRTLNGGVLNGAAANAALTLQERDQALAAGIDRINGLPILGEAGLQAFYETNVQGGVNSFTLAVNSFDDFAPAIERKLAAEIKNVNPVPEGGPGLVTCGVVLVGLAGAHRRMRRRG